MTDLFKIIEALTTQVEQSKSGPCGLLNIRLTAEESQKILQQLHEMQIASADSLVGDAQKIRCIESAVAPEFMSWAIEKMGPVTEITAYEDNGVPYFAVRYAGRDGISVRVPAQYFVVSYF